MMASRLKTLQKGFPLQILDFKEATQYSATGCTASLSHAGKNNNIFDTVNPSSALVVVLLLSGSFALLRLCNVEYSDSSNVPITQLKEHDLCVSLARDDELIA